MRAFTPAASLSVRSVSPRGQQGNLPFVIDLQGAGHERSTLTGAPLSFCSIPLVHLQSALGGPARLRHRRGASLAIGPLQMRAQCRPEGRFRSLCIDACPRTSRRENAVTRSCRRCSIDHLPGDGASAILAGSLVKSYLEGSPGVTWQPYCQPCACAATALI